MTEEEHCERYLAAQLACQKLADDLYQDPHVQARYPNGIHSMFALAALVQVTPISVLARAMEAKLEYLRTFQRISLPGYTAE